MTGSESSNRSSRYPRIPESGEPLQKFWDKPVSELAIVPSWQIGPEEGERHTIYSLATLALVKSFWNGNKYGQEGEYPWRCRQRRDNGTYEGDRFGDRYIGHNIACIAVDGNGEIIDFEFNHNEIFASSTEHAEARLVRRIFGLNQIYDRWQTDASLSVSPPGYSTVLSDVTIYTSLESCAQCSGIMTLGNVGKVVFLQSDPGQYLIGNIMYNATRPPTDARAFALYGAAAKYGAPEPIDADLFGFAYKAELDDGYKHFREQITSDPEAYFFRPVDGEPIARPSITSYLCTDHALGILERASCEFSAMNLRFPDYQPAGSSSFETLSNSQALDHARGFLNFASEQGRRGTPHK